MEGINLKVKERNEISISDQKKAVTEERFKCLKQIVYGHSINHIEGSHCNTTWDGIACWQATRPGDTAEQQCPAYIHGFYTSGIATRRCMPNGKWYVHPEFNQTWTNYSSCSPKIVQNPTHPAHILQDHLESLQLMYHIGYGISIISLSVAFFLMVYFKRLRCPRNIVHLNLFLSFILRGALSFLKDSLLIDGLGLPDDVVATSLGGLKFKEDGSHWECKTLLTSFHYVLLANYFWLFIEGLYLHTLIIVAVFSEKSRIRWYIIMGWISPLIFVIPWIVVRILFEDTLCWNTNPSPGYLWIMRAPVVLSILVNFAFFVNIVRVLFSKLKNYSTPKSRRCRHRRLAKSTLVLIPLFGVHYMLFIGLPDKVPPTLELVRLYYEMFFNSFEGFFVALLYCFLNREVQSEIRKKWIRYKLKTNSRRFQKIQWQTTASSKYVAKKPSHALNSISSEKRDIKHFNFNSDSDNELDERRRFQFHIEIRPLNGHKLQSSPNSFEKCRVMALLIPEDVYG